MVKHFFYTFERMKTHVRKYQKFVANDIWHVQLDKFPRWQRGGIKLLRIVLLSIKDFNDKQLILRSSALTYYTLLSIVPVVAMILVSHRVLDWKLLSRNNFQKRFQVSRKCGIIC
jgi:hypothetical protein